MLHVMICEDEPVQAEALRRQVQTLLDESKTQIGTVYSAAQLRAFLEQRLEIDILLLDIALDEDDGVALAAEVNLLLPSTQIIYITAYLEHCSRVYETEHVWFLTKPVSDESLRRALDRAAHHLEQARPRSLTLRTTQGQQTFFWHEILYLMSEGRKVRIHTQVHDWEVYGKLDELERKCAGCFIRCHKSFLVNADMVTGLQEQHFLLSNGDRVPISHRLAAQARRRYFDFVGSALGRMT